MDNVCDQFKRDLRSLKTYKRMVNDYQERIDEIDHIMLNLKSPAIGVVSGGHSTTDKKVALIVAKIEVERLQSAYKTIVDLTELRLSRLDREEQEILKELYIDRIPSEQIANEHFVSERSLFRWINRTIVKAVGDGHA